MARASGGIAFAVVITVWFVAAAAGVSSARKQPPYRATATAPVNRLTYDSFRSPHGLWAMNADGSDPKPFRAGVFGSSWSADRKLIAFDTVSPVACVFGASPGKVEVMNANGSGLRQLGTGCFPEISPDGLHVVYWAQDAQGNDQVWVAATDGSTNVQVLPGSCTDHQCKFALLPNWAGNSELVFVASRQDPQTNDLSPALWTIASDGSQSAPSEIPGTESSTGFALGVNGVAVDPQGKTILATGADENGDHVDLYTLPLTGGAPRLLSGAPANHYYAFPQWSPDGKVIAFGDLQNIGTSQNAVYISHVSVMPATGGTPTEISGSDKTAADPSFAPGMTITGHVTGIGTDKPVRGVTIKATGPKAVQTRSGKNGRYSLTVADPGTYKVTPGGLGAKYKPDSATVDTTQGGQMVDFEMGYKVSGTVTEDCPRCAQSSPLADASVVAAPKSGGGPGSSAITAGDGTYSMLLGPDTYSVTGSKAGFDFNPGSGTLAVAKARPRIDFSACPSSPGAASDVSGNSWTEHRAAHEPVFRCTWTVQVHVRVPDGEPVQGSYVKAFTNGWFGSDVVGPEPTNQSGWATLSVPAGDWTIAPREANETSVYGRTPAGASVDFQDTVPQLCERPVGSPPVACMLKLGSGVGSPQMLHFEAPDALIQGAAKSYKTAVTISAKTPTGGLLGAIRSNNPDFHFDRFYSLWAYARNGDMALIRAVEEAGTKGTVTKCSPGKIQDHKSCALTLKPGSRYDVDFQFP